MRGFGCARQHAPAAKAARAGVRLALGRLRVIIRVISFPRKVDVVRACRNRCNVGGVMSLALWLTIELLIVAFFLLGWILWHRRQKAHRSD